MTILGIPWIRKDAMCLFLKLWNIIYLGASVSVHCPTTMSNLSNFRCRHRSGFGKMWKCKNLKIYWISNKTGICVFRYIKSHMRSCSGHGTVLNISTHWGREKMVHILQTFSNAISWMKTCKFRLILHWSLFLRVTLTIFHLMFR